MAERWRRTTCDALFGSSGPAASAPLKMPMAPFFCTFDLFLFGDAELMGSWSNKLTKKICL